ncbi:MAG: hypothetical protein WC325_09355 [Candidatus Bathyarchaeia archaeon]|jgi:hypothetical protein
MMVEHKPEVSNDLFVRLINRRRCAFREIDALITDPKAKQLLFHLCTLSNQLLIVNPIIDPAVSGRINTKTLSANWVANTNKQWLIRNRATLIPELNKLLLGVQDITTVLFNTQPIVSDVTNLTENLGKIYRTIIDHIEKITSLTSKIEATAFSDEVLQYVSEIRNTWTELTLLLTNQIIVPLKNAIQEEARTKLVGLVGDVIYDQ